MHMHTYTLAYLHTSVYSVHTFIHLNSGVAHMELEIARLEPACESVSSVTFLSSYTLVNKV